LAVFYLINKKPKPLPPPPEQEQKSSSGYNGMIPDVIYNLNGTIKEISGNIIVVEGDAPYWENQNGSADEPDENNQLPSTQRIRQIQINSETEITRLDLVVHKETGKLMSQEVKITLKDLKTGDRVTVISSQNIKDKEVFQATKIRLMSGSNK